MRQTTGYWAPPLLPIVKRRPACRGRLLRVMALAATLPLAGCISPITGGTAQFAQSGGDDQNPQPRKALRRTSLVRGAVIVQGPRGYCIDAESLTSGGVSGGFALLASCESLLGKPADAPVDPAIMTVTVLPFSPRPIQPRAHEMAKALAPHHVLDQINGDGLTIVHLATGGTEISSGVDPKHWRGAMLINGHMIGLAVYAPKGSALSDAAGLEVLIGLAEVLREASPVRAAKVMPDTARAAKNSQNSGLNPISPQDADQQHSRLRIAGAETAGGLGCAPRAPRDPRQRYIAPAAHAGRFICGARPERDSHHTTSGKTEKKLFPRLFPRPDFRK